MAYGVITVGSGTPVLIVAANTTRNSLIIHNNGSSKVYIGSDSSITSASAGSVIISNGNLTEDKGDGRMYQGDYYGIAENSTNAVFYWERESSL